MGKNWYALHSHHQKENLLYEQVLSRGFEVYYPRIPAHPVNPRARKIHPYFPGYMFVQTDLKASGMSVFQWMPFSVGLVAFGGEAAIVPDTFMHLLQQKVDEIISSGGEIFTNLKHGDAVLIQSGPFAQYTAIFDYRISGGERVRVLLKMLNNRLVPMELNISQIEQIKKNRS